MRTGKYFSRLLPLLLCLVMMAFMASCGSDTSSTATGQPAASPDHQVYTYPQASTSGIKTFDPALSIDYNSTLAIDMVFTGLVQLDDHANVQPQLARSWQEAPDGFTWTFHLKPHLEFSDKTPLTSKDVAYSIDRALQPALKSATAPIYLALIKDADKLLAGKIPTIIGDSIQTPDANTVVIVTNKKASYFLNALTYPCSYVIEKSLIDRYGSQHFTDHLTSGGGAGPFTVSEYNQNKQIVFVPNPNYYGPRPLLQKVVMPFYQDMGATYHAYQTDQVDTTLIPANALVQTRQQTKEFHQVPQLATNYYGMNYQVKPFDNIHIRQAFELAVNKDEIVHTIWKDTYIPTNHIVPQGMPGYNPNLKGPDGTTSTSGNPEKAKVLLQQGLKEEGWSSVSQVSPIKLTYSTGSQDTDNEVKTIIQMWQSVLGISVVAHPVDANEALNEIFTNKLQFWLTGWIADYPDPQDWLTLQFDSGVPNNNVNYGQNSTTQAARQQAVQQTLEIADVNTDQEARISQYNQAEQLLVNDVAWMPIEQVSTAILLKPCVQGMVFNSLGITPPDDWGKVYISTDTPCSQH